jgi:CRP-like cAMP-binding protein
MPSYSAEALRSVLSVHFLFREMPPAVLDELVRLGTVRTFMGGQEIFQKGDPGEALYGVLAGRVRIYTVSEGGEEVLLDLVERGGIFGEIALIDGSGRSASAAAMRPSDLLEIRREPFTRLLRNNVDVCMDLLGVLCRRLRGTNELVEDLQFLPLSGRLAKRLTNLAKSHGDTVALGTRIKLRLTQTDLATMVGASRERVNRVIGDWQRHDILAVEDGFFVLKAPEKLRPLVDEH